MVDKETLKAKLAKITECLIELKQVEQIPFETYRKDKKTKGYTERLLQLIVEAASDINDHITVSLGKRPPEDYKTSFRHAAEAKLILNELAEELEKSAGMRNILVHEYMKIDDQIVYSTIPLAIKHYTEYVKQVNAFLKKFPG
ncbi:MAG: DUF86 domain-containing protein [Candidatus Margulisbacteria bacterium]|nr:DUF86 domain-containing protein [Candidatus Margulisiibacteriota bacterium]